MTGKQFPSIRIILALLLIGGIISLSIFNTSFLKQLFIPPPLYVQPNQTQPQIPQIKKSEPFMVYGYLPYWTRSKAIISPVVTHVSYFSLEIQADGKILNLLPANQEQGYRAYQRGVLTNLRQELGVNQKLELTLTMMNQDAIPVFVQNPQAQDQFLQDLSTIVREAPISGINIDIEYNGLVDDALQENVVTLLHRTNTLLKQQTPPISLSVATYADAGNLQRLTNIQTIAPEVDHIIMMAYDYHRSKSLTAGPNSPLYGKSMDKWSDDIMSNLGMYAKLVPAHKILLGIPFYGYVWSVEDISNPNSFTLPKTGSSVPYENIKKMLSLPNVKRHWDSQAMSPYLTYTQNGVDKILYYDDARSMQYKIQLVQQAGLGGIAIWALGYEGDDLELWNTIQNELNK